MTGREIIIAFNTEGAFYFLAIHKQQQLYVLQKLTIKTKMR